MWVSRENGNSKASSARETSAGVRMVTASGETLVPNTVAMWTAISNPLLLISQVLRKSMELQEPDANQRDGNTLNIVRVDDVASQREFIIERHAAPTCEPADER